MISICVLLDDFCPRATALLAKKKKKKKEGKERKRERKRKILCPANASSSTLHPLLLIQCPLNLIKPTWILDFFF